MPTHQGADQNPSQAPIHASSATMPAALAISTLPSHLPPFMAINPIELRAVQQRRVDSRPGVPIPQPAGAAHICGGA